MVSHDWLLRRRPGVVPTTLLMPYLSTSRWVPATNKSHNCDPSYRCSLGGRDKKIKIGNKTYSRIHPHYSSTVHIAIGIRFSIQIHSQQWGLTVFSEIVTSGGIPITTFKRCSLPTIVRLGFSRAKNMLAARRKI